MKAGREEGARGLAQRAGTRSGIEKIMEKLK
jgi:hypothetical protein